MSLRICQTIGSCWAALLRASHIIGMNIKPRTEQWADNPASCPGDKFGSSATHHVADILIDNATPLLCNRERAIRVTSNDTFSELTHLTDGDEGAEVDSFLIVSPRRPFRHQLLPTNEEARTHTSSDDTFDVSARLTHCQRDAGCRPCGWDGLCNLEVILVQGAKRESVGEETNATAQRC